MDEGPKTWTPPFILLPILSEMSSTFSCLTCMTLSKLFKSRVGVRLFPTTATVSPRILHALCNVTPLLHPRQFPFHLNLVWLYDICEQAEHGGHDAMSLAAPVFALWEEE